MHSLLPLAPHLLGRNDDDLGTDRAGERDRRFDCIQFRT
jgi:hypothetical protein